MMGQGDQHDRGDWTDASVSESVITAVADKAGVDPIVLPPLYERIDPDALNTLIEPETRDFCSVTFVYAGHVVEVVRDGEFTITVDERDPE